jgi:hypothetical protein
MIFVLRWRMAAASLLGSILILVNASSYAGGPSEPAAQKGSYSPCKHCGKKEGLWCTHKPFLHHWMPPMLPVLQSQAVRSTPAEAEPVRMRVQVRAVEEEPVREPLRDEDRPREPFRHDGWPPYQKGPSPLQKSQYLSAGTEGYDFDQRLSGLERQFEILLDRLERLAEQRDQESPSVPLRLRGND